MALKSVNVLVVACLLAFYTQAQGECANAKVAKYVEINISEKCSNCICEVASGCDINAGCNGDVCGPLRITWGYWSDAGKPTVDDEPADADDAFVRCANDLACAKRALQGYINRYAKDCNGNGEINCDDFVRIHRYGPWGCSQPLPSSANKVYERCMKPTHN